MDEKEIVNIKNKVYQAECDNKADSNNVYILHENEKYYKSDVDKFLFSQLQCNLLSQNNF